MKNRINIVSVVTVFLITYTTQRSVLKSEEFNKTNDKPQTFSFKMMPPSISRYETKNGTRREENVFIYPNANGNETTHNITGRFSYIAPDERTYGAVYKADENGYHPKFQFPFENDTETTTMKKLTEDEIGYQIGTAAQGSLAGGGIG